MDNVPGPGGQGGALELARASKGGLGRLAKDLLQLFYRVTQDMTPGNFG